MELEFYILDTISAEKTEQFVAEIPKVELHIHLEGAIPLELLLDFIRREYFNDDFIEPAARLDFTLAAYNAGPHRIESLREKAKEMGLDPNRWFFNVEYVARREMGLETVRYVANVTKYYIAYKSIESSMGPELPSRSSGSAL